MFYIYKKSSSVWKPVIIRKKKIIFANFLFWHKVPTLCISIIFWFFKKEGEKFLISEGGEGGITFQGWKKEKSPSKIALWKTTASQLKKK